MQHFLTHAMCVCVFLVSGLLKAFLQGANWSSACLEFQTHKIGVKQDLDGHETGHAMHRSSLYIRIFSPVYDSKFIKFQCAYPFLKHIGEIDDMMMTCNTSTHSRL